MNLSKPFLLLPVASLFLAGAVSAGACSSSVSVGIPPESSPPPGAVFIGGTFGASCDGDIYATSGTGWAFCDNGTWEFTADDPSAFTGYTEVDTDDSGSDDSTAPSDDSGDDSTAPSDDSGDDATTPTDDAGDDSAAPTDAGGEDSGNDDAGDKDGGQGP